jgi:hypothetical protein
MMRTVFYLGTTLIWSGCTCASEVTIAPPLVPPSRATGSA